MVEENNYKLKIDVAHGLFEAEGSEEFVKQGFDSFKEVIKDKKTSFTSSNDNSDASNNTLTEKRNVGTRKIGKSSIFSIVKDLNLKPKDKKSLKEFCGEKKPDSNIERNTVFVYYLQKILNVTNITIDHIFTCYKEMGVRIPMNLKQSIVDTASSRYGYLDGSNMQNIILIVRGENLVEHDLPRKSQE